MPFADLDGTDLFYEEQGAGPGLVFLHGAAGNHVSWWRQLPAFSGRFRCVAIDHRGFGRSTDPGGESASRFADDLESLLERLGIGRAALVAQSMGGRAALGYAVRRSERVSALVLAGAPASIGGWPEPRGRIARAQAAAGGAVAPAAERALGERFRRREPALAFLYRQIAGLNPPGAADAVRAVPPGPATRADLAALGAPALLIAGGDDALTPPGAIRELHEAIPGSELREFAGCGHSVYFEEPDGFNEAVADFLARRAERTHP